MPTLDRVVSIGPPSRVRYNLTAFAIATYPIEDGDDPSQINLRGEAAFGDATGLIAWYDFDRAVTVRPTRFANATRLMFRAPAGPGGFPRLATFGGGEVRVSAQVDLGPLVPLYRFDMISGAVVDGLYCYGLSGYRWLYVNPDDLSVIPLPANTWQDRRTPIREDVADDLRFALELSWVVNARKAWARVVESASLDVVSDDTGFTETRRYEMRWHEDITPLAELVDDGVRWQIVGVDEVAERGRRRFVEVNVQRTVSGGN